MKQLYTSLFVLFTFFSYSQSIPTVGEIFDFAVGDTFVYARYPYYQPVNPYRTTINAVSNKSVSGNNSVFYTVQSFNTFRNYLGQYQHNSEVLTQSYIQLVDTINSTIVCDPMNFTITDTHAVSATQETLFGKTVYKLSSFCGPCHFENYYAIGLGCVRVKNYCQGDDNYTGYMSDLIYYHKTNGETWGNFINLLEVGINESQGITATTSVFPNPASQQIIIHHSGPTDKEVLFKLFDPLGKQVKSIHITAENTSLDRDGLPAGMYFWSNESQVQIFGKGKLILE